MTPISEANGRPRVSTILAVLAACAVLVWFAWPSNGPAPDTERPRIDAPPSNSRKGGRSPTRPPPTVPPATNDVSSAVAMGADGKPLVGTPPPYEAKRPDVDYHFLIVESEDRTRELASLRPDHEGNFTLPADAANQPVRLYAMHDGSAVVLEHATPVLWTDIVGKQVVFEEPTVGRHVAFRCIDDTGVAVRAKVSLERRSGHDWRTLEKLEIDESGRAATRVAGAGDFRVRLLSTENRTMRFVDPPQRRFSSPSDLGAELEFVVPRAAEIIVDVVDGRGRPLPGALVGLSVSEAGRIRPHPQGRTTDEEGRVHLRGIAPGDVILRATMLGHIPVVRARTVQSGANHESFALTPGGTKLTVQFTGVPASFPTADRVGVHVLRVSAVTSEMMAFLGAKLSEDWKVELEGLPRGEYQMMLMPTTGERVAFWFTVADENRDLGSVDLTGVFTKGPVAMDVRVENGEDTPSEAPTVLFRNETWAPNVWRRMRSWVSESHSLDNLTPGEYRLRLSPQSHDPDVWDLGDVASVTLTDGTESPTVVLHMRRKTADRE